MGKVRIVTDSSAQFLDPAVVKRFGISIVPTTIHFGGQTFREGIDLDAEDFFQYILTEGMPAPTLEAPSVADFIREFGRLSRKTERIVAIHMAQGLSDAWKNAQIARESFLGRSEIIVVDSMTTSVGLGFLTETAARAAASTDSLGTVVRAIRGAVPRIYSVFYVETLDYLFRNELIGEAQAILGKILGIKPFLTVENSKLVPMEKVRTRSQAVDKLIEFVSEFSAVEHIVILQNTPHITDQTRLLQDRLAAKFEGHNFPVMMYGPTLGTHLGPDGVGIVVYEAEKEKD